jgi:16S rRNA (guanine527-N7)-methyltransferase
LVAANVRAVTLRVSLSVFINNHQTKHMNDLWNQLADGKLTEQQDAQLSRYLDLLVQANQRMNLTRITDRSAAEIGHVGDALTLLRYLPPSRADAPIRLADVGSGGGVPGIPLAIARPDVSVTLIESTAKKARFLTETAEAMGLSNLKVRTERAEEAGNGPVRESFDIVTARAIGVMAWLVEWCLPLVKTGGTLLALKGPKLAEELPAALRTIRILGGGEPTVHPVELPGTDGHVIVAIRKVRTTDHRFPRPATSAKGKPLG